MIDSGAECSIIKSNLLDKNTEIIKTSWCLLTGVTPGEVKTAGTSTISLDFGNDMVLKHEFQIVAPEFPILVDGILGKDFFKLFKCIINYDTYILTVCEKNFVVEIPFVDTLENGYFILPKRSQVVRKLDLNFKENSVIHSEELMPGVFCANSLIGSLPYVKFINTTETDVLIKNFRPKSSKLSEYKIFNLNNEQVTQNCEKRIERLMKELNLQNIPDFGIESIRKICQEFNEIFHLENDILDVNNFYTQKIPLTDYSPIYIKNYKLPQYHKNEIESQVNKMLKEKIVENSVSPYNSPLLIVPKKGGTHRVVVDFRSLNKKVIADKFPLPRIDDILDQLGRAKFFTILDLKNSFHQIELEKNSRPLTAFSTSNGHYQFRRLPFGLKISPNSFQRMMAIAMAGLSSEAAFLYIDDIVVVGCSLQHHNSNLIKIFQRLKQYNLKLNPGKCFFLQTAVTYLGHKISDKGIEPDLKKYDVILNYPIPKNQDDVRRYVAFCNYYRRFVKNFATLAKPLNDLLKKKTLFAWTESCQNAFDCLKQCLIEPPILQYPDFSKEFILTTDASNVACGAVLSQVYEGKNLPIAFASKSFSQGERNKSTIEKELTAIHWAVTYFKSYLYGRKFKIYTDHKPLVYLFTMKNPSSKLTRMRWDLEEFNYEVCFIKGKHNKVADALSRIDVDSDMLKNLNVMAITRSMNTKELNENDTSTSTRKPDHFAVVEALSQNDIKGLKTLKFKNEILKNCHDTKNAHKII